MKLFFRLALLIGLYPTTSHGQAIIEVYYNGIKQEHEILYFYSSSKTFALGYLIPSCTWEEINDTVCRLEIEVGGKRYFFGLLHVNDLAKATTLSFHLKEHSSSAPKIIHYTKHTANIIGSRKKLPDESSNELWIID